MRRFLVTACATFVIWGETLGVRTEHSPTLSSMSSSGVWRDDAALAFILSWAMIILGVAGGFIYEKVKKP